MAVGEGITIPAVGVTEGTVGRMAAHGPVESAAPALGVSGLDSLADLGGGDLVGDGLPGGEGSAIDTAGGETGHTGGLGVGGAEEALGDFSLEAVGPEVAAEDVGASCGAVHGGGGGKSVRVGAISVGASVVLALGSDVGHEGAIIAVHGVGLDAGGVVGGVAADLTVDVSGQFLLAVVGRAQPALLGAIFETVGPVLALGGLGASVGAGSVRHRDPLVGILAVVQEATGQAVHGDIGEESVLVISATLATQDSVFGDAAREDALEGSHSGSAADEKRCDRFHLVKYFYYFRC